MVSISILVPVSVDVLITILDRVVKLLERELQTIVLAMD